MNFRFLLMTLLVLAFVPATHAQQLYKWVDDKGKISYHDRPPPQDSGYTVEVKSLGSTRAPTSTAAVEAAKNFPVTLYVAPKCGSCDTARAYLQKRGVPFSEKNVEGDRKLQDELIKMAGGLSVPTILIGSKVMRGYLESLLEDELKSAGYLQPVADENAEPQEQEQAQEQTQESPAGAEY